MKKICLIFLIIMFFVPCLGIAEEHLIVGGHKIKVSVDPRIEAVGIIFYLAGSNEYSQCLDKEYLEKVRAHFSPRKDHPAVKTAAILRETKHIWFGAPMSLACHLEEDFTLASDTIESIEGGSLDFRFTLQEARDFANQIKDFVAQSNLMSFMTDNRERHQHLEESLQAMVDRIDPSWFSNNFPAPGDCEFKLFVSLMNGHNNYGTHRKTHSGYIVCPVIGVWNFDAKGNAQFGSDIIQILLHECSHPFLNPVADAYMDILRGPAKKLAETHFADFSRTGYGEDGYSDDLIYESLAWAGACLYTDEHEGLQAAEELKTMAVKEGWTWLPDIINCIRYVKNSGLIKSNPQKAMNALSDTFTRCAEKRN